MADQKRRDYHRVYDRANAKRISAYMKDYYAKHRRPFEGCGLYEIRDKNPDRKRLCASETPYSATYKKLQENRADVKVVRHLGASVRHMFDHNRAEI